MLVLTRGEGEQITIGGGITITVLATRGREVRIGIDAPPDTPIVRPDAIRQEPHNG